MILMIDNYDSFTYNVVQYLGELKADVQVIRNDDLSLDEIESMNLDHKIRSSLHDIQHRTLFVQFWKRCNGFENQALIFNVKH